MSAFVVAPQMTAAQVKRMLRDRIDPAFMPRPLHVVDSLPRTETGKLTKSALARLVRDVGDGRR